MLNTRGGRLLPRGARDIISTIGEHAKLGPNFEEGVTVSTWIRQAVHRELRRRTAEPDHLATGTSAS